MAEKNKPAILVVDDQPQNNELLEAFLVPQGYEVIMASNGEEALGKLAGNQINLILLDVIMPGMDGFEVTHRIRQDNVHRMVPIILVTSLKEPEDRVKGMEAGCDDFISKPVDKVELLARVRSLLKVKDYNDLMSNYRKELESEITRRTKELNHSLENLQREITERKKAEAELLRMNRLYDVLSQVNQTVVRASDEVDLLKQGCQIIADRGQFKLAWIGRLEPQTRVVIPVTAAGVATEYAKSVNATADDRPEGQCPSGSCIRNNTPVIINDYLNDPRTLLWRQRSAPYAFGGVAGFPIVVDGTVWGAITVYSATVGYFGDKEVKLLEEATGDIGFGLGNIKRERQRKQAEYQLKASEEKYRNLFNNAEVGMFRSRADGSEILDLNQKYADILGYSREESIIIPSVYLWVDPQERARMLSILQTQGSVVGFECRLIKKNGESIDCLTSLRLYPETGILEGSIVDITERKKAEAEHQNLRDKAEMSSRLAAVGEMAAGIAHEINNPLTGVIGFSELLLTENLPPEIKEQLQIIADGSNRVKDIVRRMLTFARQTGLVKTSANINDLIDNTLGIRSYVLRTANIEVIRDFDPDLPWVTADPGQLQQVFLNLIVNAEFAMKKAHDKGDLTITTEAKDGHIRISFRDNGPGMSPEIIKKVFNPFFTTKDIDEGTGLGLSLSRSIILEHGGTIEVESEPGKGANFIITLPLTPIKEEAISEIAADITAPPEKVRAARILVVDDEYGIRSLVSKILTTSGHTVDTIGDPDVVLLKLANISYDVVIMDIRMPGMSGMELYTKIIKQYPGLAKKIIFITGDTSDLGVRDYLKHHVPYITKPFDRETLLKQVNRLL